MDEPTDTMDGSIGGMSLNEEIALIWPMLREKGLPYPPKAYALVQRGLRHAVQQMFDEGGVERMEGDRHISGQELCFGIRDMAMDEFGPLAKTVLNSWGVYHTEDFGEMVAAMVETGLLRMSERDSMDDFAGVYDFDEAFGCDLDAAGSVH